MRKIVAAVVLATSVLSFAGTRPAFACSCAGGPVTVTPDPNAAAFVGTVTSEHTAWWRLFRMGDDYSFRVESVLSGDVHQTVSVTAKSGPSASCGGFSASVGERMGVLASRVSGRWEANLCSRADPVELLAQPIAHPPAPGPSPGPSVGTRVLDVWPWILPAVVVFAVVLRSRRARVRARYALDDPWT